MYKIVFRKSAQKQLEKLPKEIIRRIVIAVDELADNPRPFGAKKLEGRLGYRIRIGDYRIIYDIEDSILTVLVLEIGDRKSIYRKK